MRLTTLFHFSRVVIPAIQTSLFGRFRQNLLRQNHSRSERFCWWLFLQRLKYNFLQFIFFFYKYIKILLFFDPNFVYIYIIYIFYYPKKGHWGRSFLVRGSWNGVCLWTNFSGIETHKLAEMTFPLILIFHNLHEENQNLPEKSTIVTSAELAEIMELMTGKKKYGSFKRWKSSGENSSTAKRRGNLWINTWKLHFLKENKEIILL